MSPHDGHAGLTPPDARIARLLALDRCTQRRALVPHSPTAGASRAIAGTDVRAGRDPRRLRNRLRNRLRADPDALTSACRHG